MPSFSNNGNFDTAAPAPLDHTRSLLDLPARLRMGCLVPCASPNEWVLVLFAASGGSACFWKGASARYELEVTSSMTGM